MRLSVGNRKVNIYYSVCAELFQVSRESHYSVSELHGDHSASVLDCDQSEFDD